MLCGHDHSENFFLSDTDLAVGLCLIALAVLHAVPVVNLVKTNCHLVLDACHTHINASVFAAVVKVGKGDARQDRSQNGGLLPIPTNPCDHTKTTKRLTCAEPYQRLPRSVLAVRNPVVNLVWSTRAYHITVLAGPPL